MSERDDKRGDPTGVSMVVAEVGTVAEAALVRHRLDAAGIPSTVFNEHMGTLLGGYYGSAIGGVKVAVPASRVREAEELLAAHADDEVEHDDTVPEEEELETPADRDDDDLPADRSRAYYLRRMWIASVLSIMAPVLLPFAVWHGVGALRAPGPWEPADRAKAGRSLAAMCVACFVLGMIVFHVR